MEVREGIQAVAFEIGTVTVREIERGIAEVVEKAMEGYKEVLETLVEVLVKMVKEMMEEAKDRVDCIDLEEGQVEELARKWMEGDPGKSLMRGMTYVDIMQNAKWEDILH